MTYFIGYGLSRNICCLLFFRALLFRQILPGLEPLLSSLREIAQKRNKTLPQVLLCTSFFHCYLLKNWWEIWEINFNNYSARVSCLIELSYLELKVSLDEKICKIDTVSQCIMDEQGIRHDEWLEENLCRYIAVLNNFAEGGEFYKLFCLIY